MIKDVIKERATQLGITNGQIAEVAETSQSQISAFFNKEASLTISSLDKIFSFLGLDIDTYENRRQLAEHVADVLVQRGYSEDGIKQMSKMMMASIVDDKRIELLIDGFELDKEAYDRMLKKDSIIPVECTYVYFKSMVLQYVELKGKKPTPGLVMNSFKIVGKNLGYAIGGVFAGVLGLGTYALFKYVTSDNEESIEKANTPLVNIAKKLLR